MVSEQLVPSFLIGSVLGILVIIYGVPYYYRRELQKCLVPLKSPFKDDTEEATRYRAYILRRCVKGLIKQGLAGWSYLPQIRNVFLSRDQASWWLSHRRELNRETNYNLIIALAFYAEGPNVSNS